MSVFSTILSFLSGPLGGLAMKVLGGVLAFGMALTLYKIHNDGIRREAVAQQNLRQIEQVVRDQRDFIRKMDEVQRVQTEMVERLRRQNEALNSRIRRATQYLESPEARAGDRSSSEVLRNTVRRLQER